MLFRLEAATPRDMEQQVSSRFARPYTVGNEVQALRRAEEVLTVVLSRHTAGSQPENASATEEAETKTGLELVKRDIAVIFRTGQATVVQRHLSRVRLILQLEFHSRCTGHFQFPPKTVPEWVRSHASPLSSPGTRQHVCAQHTCAVR